MRAHGVVQVKQKRKLNYAGVILIEIFNRQNKQFRRCKGKHIFPLSSSILAACRWAVSVLLNEQHAYFWMSGTRTFGWATCIPLNERHAYFWMSGTRTFEWATRVLLNERHAYLLIQQQCLSSIVPSIDRAYLLIELHTCLTIWAACLPLN